MKYPRWKRSLVRKAARLRRKLSDKALAIRLNVPLSTIEYWGRDLWHTERKERGGGL